MGWYYLLLSFLLAMGCWFSVFALATDLSSVTGLTRVFMSRAAGIAMSLGSILFFLLAQRYFDDIGTWWPLIVFTSAAIIFGSYRLMVLYLMEGGVKGVVDFLFASGARAIRNPVRCDEARAAEKRGDLAEAERLYHALLTGKIRRDMFVHLGLGDLYRTMKQPEKAICHWSQALEGELPDDLCIGTAIRLSELMRETGKPADRILDLLDRTIARFPDAVERTALLARREALMS